MIVDLLKVVDDRRDVDADICVIGAGTAGLPLSQELARRSFNVVVLECGGLDGNSGLLDRRHQADPLEPTGPNGWIKAVGGSSRIWGGRLIGLSPDELQARPYMGLPAWPVPLAELDAHTGAVEALFQIPHGTFATSADWVCKRYSRHLPAASPVIARYPVIVDRRRRDVSQLLHSSNSQPTVYANASVCDFSVDRSTARLASIEARSAKGNSINVSARHFVIASGAIESTKLLLWLNRRENGNIFKPAQNLGRYLQDHIGYPSGLVGIYQPELLSALLGLRSRDRARRAAHFNLSPTIQRTRSLPNAYLNFQISPRDMGQIARIRNAAIASSHGGIGGAAAALAKSPHDLALAAMLAAWYLSKTRCYLPPRVDVIAQIALEQMPSAANGITLSDRLDRHGMPGADVAWEPSDIDDDNARRIQPIFEAFWTQSGLSHSCPVQWHPPTQNGRRPATSLFHPCACIAMGTDPATTIVDPDLNCHDVPNLSVLSTAVLPSAGSGNPTMPLLQLAYRLAGAIEGRYRARIAAQPADDCEVAQSGNGKPAMVAS